MYPRLRYAQEKIIFACKKKYFEKRLFDTKLDFHLIKKTKHFWGNFKNTWKSYCFAIKKMLFIQFPYMEIVWEAFFQKKNKISVLSSPDLFIRIKHPQKLVKIFFSTIFRNCMKTIWQAFFYTFDVWNFMISIFGLWRSTRVALTFMSELKGSVWYKKKQQNDDIIDYIIPGCSDWVAKPWMFRLIFKVYGAAVITFKKFNEIK